MEFLDISRLRSVLERFAPGVDVEGDGIYGLQWRSTETFYRQTEGYVPDDHRAQYKQALEREFPGRRGVL